MGQTNALKADESERPLSDTRKRALKTGELSSVNEASSFPQTEEVHVCVCPEREGSAESSGTPGGEPAQLSRGCVCDFALPTSLAVALMEAEAPRDHCSHQAEVSLSLPAVGIASVLVFQP